MAQAKMKLRGDHCQCSGPPYKGCGEYFNSTAAFDRHRVGPFMPPGLRRCLTVPEMLAKGMVRNSKGFWVSEPMPLLARGRRKPRAIDPTPYPESAFRAGRRPQRHTGHSVALACHHRRAYSSRRRLTAE